MDKYIVKYPKGCILYRGTNNKNAKGYWFTDDISYACKYSYGKNGAIQVCRVSKDLKLIDITKVNETMLDNTKNITVSNKTEKITISLRELFRIIFGKNHIKTPPIKTIADVESLEKFDSKYKNSQYFKFLKLYYLLKGSKKLKERIKYLKNIINSKDRKVITSKKQFNRLNLTCIDVLFIKHFKKQFTDTDGIIAPHIKSDWTLYECEKGIDKKIWNPNTPYNKSYLNNVKCSFYQYSEIGLNNLSKINIKNKITNYKSVCKRTKRKSKKIKSKLI